MQVRFLLGPAGAGKTYRCLAEIRAELTGTPDGPPLILLAPKQATFQLERQLLETLPGYTRLHILSFERLARFILKELRHPLGELLSEEGRVMLLRALVAHRRSDLQIFHASSGLTGFARQLSEELRQLQRHQLSPRTLDELSARSELSRPLRQKLHDLSLLLGGYLDWMRNHEIQDAETLLDLAVDGLRHTLESSGSNPSGLQFAGLWLDGFAELTPQELNLLAAVVPYCQRATLAFCLAPQETDQSSWLSIWSGVRQTFHRCWSRLSGVTGASLSVIALPEDASKTRFAQNPALQHLEANWSHPKLGAFEVKTSDFRASKALPAIQCPIRMAVCATPEAEAVLAAHEILRFVRSGGRYREAAILLRQMEGYHEILRRVLSRYEIPFFLDRREPVAHHPLVELTRNGLRTLALGWRHEDWFGALKTGLVWPDDGAIDELENAALAHGWQNDAWLQPLTIAGHQIEWAECLRLQCIAPFAKLKQSLGATLRPSGEQLADALRRFWDQARVEETLQKWNQAGLDARDLVTTTDAVQGQAVVHTTVWERLNQWVEDLQLAFGHERMPLRDWLPILEAGMSGLTVGIIPPSLDQVLVGTIDRSRNPDLKVALVLGLNETVFPAEPRTHGLLSESDHEELDRCAISLNPTVRQLLSRERYFGYIACTRARERLVLTCAQRDARDKPLNPSPFFAQVQSLFPPESLKLESYSPPQELNEAEHACELTHHLLQKARENKGELAGLMQLPAVAALRQQLHQAATAAVEPNLSSDVASQLYGPVLHTSVSRMEQFAACPFRFFIDSGLRAEERKLFELDAREKGTFQHAALAEFHQELRSENKRWHDLTPTEGRQRMARVVARLGPGFREGLFSNNARAHLACRGIAESLQEFIGTLIEWMPQYEFEPVAVELGFGSEKHDLPGWELELGQNQKLLFRGVIDRIDLCPIGNDEALAVVLDYKSSAKKLEPRLLENGLQLQLPAYLSVLKRLPEPERFFGVKRLIPAGVFYINLNGQFKSGKTRDEVLGNLREARHAAYQHTGRFDFAALPHLDNRGAMEGTQFKFRLRNDGQPYKSCADVLKTEDFQRMLDQVESHLLTMGKRIFAGDIRVDPYQKGTERACDRCDFAPICRIDPWSHPFRVLRTEEAGEEPAPS